MKRVLGRHWVSIWIAFFGLVSNPTWADSSGGPEAARKVAETDSTCNAIRPFYWEIGSAQGPIVGGSVGGSVQRTTEMMLASASKLYFAAYVVERTGGRLSAPDLKALRMQTGFTRFEGCKAEPQKTIGSCMSRGTNSQYYARHDGFFYYGGGHFQFWAEKNGLSAMNRAQLGAEFERYLGKDAGARFFAPQPSAGMSGNAASYAQFLIKILQGKLLISQYLGSQKVCTEPKTCPTSAASPVDPAWHYSLGHWVEDDPKSALDDGSFSSTGAFGFYPWITADRRHYGMIAREDRGNGPGKSSNACGKRIRRAFLAN